MPFSGGIFDRTNGSFTGSTVWQQDAAAGVQIVDSRHDFHDQDIANGLSECILKDGTQTITADIPFNSFKATQLGPYTTLSDAVNADMFQQQGANWGSTTAGTNTAYTLSLTPTPSGYTNGMVIRFVPHTNCGNAPTINVNGMGAKTLTYFTGQGLFANQLLADQLHYAVFTANQFLVLNAYRPILTWTPTLGFAGGAGGTTLPVQTVNSNIYQIDGKSGWFNFNANVQWGVAAPDYLTFTLPFTVASTNYIFFGGKRRLSTTLNQGSVGTMLDASTGQIWTDATATSTGLLYTYSASGQFQLA